LKPKNSYKLKLQKKHFQKLKK